MVKQVSADTQHRWSMFCAVRSSCIGATIDSLRMVVLSEVCPYVAVSLVP